MPRDLVIGWDIGGAHVKAARIEEGRVRDIAQWPCPLWQGLEHVDNALAQAALRWPDLAHADHAVTMTGEMADLFEHREAGVAAIAARLASHCGERIAFYAGASGWVAPDSVAAHWERIASANWFATAQLVASRIPHAVLVDIGSTTTDLIPIQDGRIVARGTDDAGRLKSGELVYQGVVRTPLCALAHRIRFCGEHYNVMNEFFATTADVYRLTGALDPLHDQQPAADGGAKDRHGTCQRLARMIGRDARDAAGHDWVDLAHRWRDAQLAHLSLNLTRVLGRTGLAHNVVLVAAGCGAFLVDALAEPLGRDVVRFDALPGIRIEASDAAADAAGGRGPWMGAGMRAMRGSRHAAHRYRYRYRYARDERSGVRLNRVKLRMERLCGW